MVFSYSVFGQTSTILKPEESGAQRRTALVIGNSAYKVSPLINPANDARDMADALRGAGFEVILRQDQDLIGMEQALTEFAGALAGKETALFYFAGHAVQVDGENYLIPVREEIQSTIQAKSRGVSLEDVLGRIRLSGIKTALVFLDACRDNPFPGSSRSGVRGLAVVAAPTDIETCIAYATQPGSTAQDGSGKNGVFTSALLDNLKHPGVSLSDLMTSVIAEVKAATGGKQQPRFDNGLSTPFYFLDAALALKRFNAEIADLDWQISERQQKIASTSSVKDKYNLEVEQQRQEAIRTARKLEAENLARSSDLQSRLDQDARQFNIGKTKLESMNKAQQDELARLVSSKRAELDKLARDTASEDPDILLDIARKLSLAIADIHQQYSQALEKSLASVTAIWDGQLAALAAQKPDITETDQEFSARIGAEEARLRQGKDLNLASLQSSSKNQEEAQTKSIRFQYEETLKSIEARTWTARGKAVELTAGEFDRNKRMWPLTISSMDRSLPADPYTFVLNLGVMPEPQKAIREMDNALKANALSGEIDWGIQFDRVKDRYALYTKTYRVRNLGTDEIVVQMDQNQTVAYLSPENRKNPTPASGTLSVEASFLGDSGDVYVDGTLVGKTPISKKMHEGKALVTVRWNDSNYMDFSETVTIGAGEIKNIRASKNETAAYSAEKAKELSKNLNFVGTIIFYGLIALGVLWSRGIIH